ISMLISFPNFMQIMNSRNRKYALLLVAAVAITATGAMSQAYAQSINDGMDGYVLGTSGIYTGNPNECWYDDGEGGMLPCRIDTGDTAWILAASSLVLFMTPGVAFFYGGLARSKNAVNVVGMVFIVIGLMSWQWVAWGYSLAFGPNDNDTTNMYMGALDYVGFNQVSHYAPLGELGLCTDTWSAAYQMQVFPEVEQCSVGWPGTVPHQMFAMFQATFAIITPALIVGGLIDRMKFSALIIFILLWGTFVYDPVAHWVWGGGIIGNMDFDPDLSPSFGLDFAGGTVVHITSGFSALAGALVLGRRLGYGKVPMEPHNVPMVVLGASILWFGWFGFNAGSTLGVGNGDLIARIALNTNIAAAMGGIFAMITVWAVFGKPDLSMAMNGALAGLVAITAPCAYVDPWAAIVIGALGGVIVIFGVVLLDKLKIDDPVGAVPVHGFNGIWGTISIGIFGKQSLGLANEGLVYGGGGLQLGIQVMGVITVILFIIVSMS
ncbi:hypothetical protein LCGC14_2518770, partial [marine sediment metagenome]